MKRFLAFLILVIFIIACIIPFLNNHAILEGAARPLENYDSGTVFIHDDPVPLGFTETTESEILVLMNQEREELGLSNLVYDSDLTTAAQVRAEECSEPVDNFSHTRPDGEDWWTVDPDVCYGENLASGYDDATEAVAAWIASPSHYENIVNGEYQACGIGIYDSYIACEFGY